MESDHLDVNNLELKRFLFTLPQKHGFEFTAEVRKEIRGQLFKSISNQCKYMNWFFPKAIDEQDVRMDGDPAKMQKRVLEKLDSLCDFSYDKYYKTSVHKKQSPKYNTHDHHAFHSGVPCSRIFRKGEPIYRCLTCGYDDTCALCSHCYQAEFHADHNVHISICTRENGGVCDCGDPEAWINEFHCPFATRDESMQFSDTRMPTDLSNGFLVTIGTLLDYVIDVMTHSDLQYSNLGEITSNFIENYSKNSSLDPCKYGFASPTDMEDTNSPEYSLMVYNDQNRHYREAVQRIRLASRKVYEFAVMVTDKAQDYGKAKVISSEDIELLQERQKVLGATGLATSIRSNRDIFREDMCDEILLWINSLTESEMFKISNEAKNLFCHAFCCRWEKGLTDQPNLHRLLLYNTGCLDFHYKIPKKTPSTAATAASEHNPVPAHWQFMPKFWDLDPELCQLCEYNLNEEDYDPQKSHLGSRFQYMVYLDTRFWKSIRFALHDMFSTSLIVNLKYKKILCCQYVDIYPAVTGIYLQKDREPELNIMATLSTQLFTCPSNSTSIMEHGDLSRIFASIYGFFTDNHAKTPEDVEINHSISMKSLRNRRWGQIFFDIGYILSRSRHSEIDLSPENIAMACDILCLFHGRPVLKRESKNHVEFENPEYSSFFQSASMIYSFAETTAHCLNNPKKVRNEQTQALSKDAISYVFRFLLDLEHNNYPGLTDANIDVELASSEPSFDNFSISSDSEEKPKFRIDTGKVAFLHPIHSFVSWLLETSSFKSIEEVGDILEACARRYIEVSGRPGSTMILFEYPIRTVVLMSQIKSGFWVRNGYGTRSQLQLYKNTSLRESGYMRDMFLIQLFSNLYAPDLVCFTILDRWLLLDGWISEVTDEATDTRQSIQTIVEKSHEAASEQTELAYDLKTLSYMLEECSNFFIHLITEDLYLRGLPADVVGRIRVETEIIQNLCFGPMSYTKLCFQIPDHIVAEKRFDIILDDLTIFTPPNTHKDFGSYRLKDSYFFRVNPYFFNYSTNTREDAIKLVKEKFSSHKKNKNDVVITPSLRPAEELGIYKYVGNFSVSSYFSKFVITCLLFVDVMGVEKTDSLLEVMLQLIHICSFENRLDVNKHGSFFDVFTNKNGSSSVETSISQLLYGFLLDESYKAHHAKIKAIFFKFNEKYDVSAAMSATITNFDINKVVDCTDGGQTESEFERKKRMAKDKQAKLMAKFKKQQSSFLKNNDMSNVEVDDIEMMDTDDDGWCFPESHCILCQDDQNDGPFGIVAYVSKSAEFWSLPFDDKYWFLKSFSDGSNLDEDEIEEGDNEYTKAWMNYMNKVKQDNVIGPGFTSHEHVNRKLVSSSCGHGMHFDCYLNFLNNRHKQNQITRNSPENYEHKEFVCPLCKAINNSFIPILWKHNKRKLSRFLENNPQVNDLNEVFSTLRSNQVAKTQWYQQFQGAVREDVEKISILTPASEDMIFPPPAGEAMSPHQFSFATLMSHSASNLQSFYFPMLFQPDSSKILTNTIKSAEIALRGESSKETLIVGQLTNNALVNLRTVTEFRNTAVLLMLRGSEKAANNVYIKQLACLESLYQPQKFTKRVLEQDFFELLVSILPVPSAGFSFNVILRAVFTGHLIQNLYLLVKNIITRGYYNCTDYTMLDVPIISSLDREKADIAVKLFTRVKSYMFQDDHDAGFVNDPKFGYVLYSMLVKVTTPFLRRAAIYSYVMCSDMSDVDFKSVNSLHLEADRLCHFLNIESIYTVLQKFDSVSPSFELTKFSDFLTNVNHIPRNEDLDYQLEYPGLIKLINLPERLDYFFSNYYYSDKYDKPHLTIENPAICLFCAEVVDIQKCAIGSPFGACTTHVLKECPNNIGIFLLPKDKTIVVLHKNGGSFMEAPYLDSHGELAAEGKRNHTLHLIKPRYDGLIKKVWLGHNIPNYIVRKLDHVIDAGGWDTL